MSALPTKYVPVEYSPIGVAALLLELHRDGDTVSSLWDRVRDLGRIRSFDRFAAALTLMFSGGLVTIERGLLSIKRTER